MTCNVVHKNHPRLQATRERLGDLTLRHHKSDTVHKKHPKHHANIGNIFGRPKTETKNLKIVYFA